MLKLIESLVDNLFACDKLPVDRNKRVAILLVVCHEVIEVVLGCCDQIPESRFFFFNCLDFGLDSTRIDLEDLLDVVTDTETLANALNHFNERASVLDQDVVAFVLQMEVILPNFVGLGHFDWECS